MDRTDCEWRLFAELIAEALKVAECPSGSGSREDARAWLRDAAAVFSARACFEGVGLDYGAARSELEARWVKIDRGEQLPPFELRAAR